LPELNSILHTKTLVVATIAQSYKSAYCKELQEFEPSRTSPVTFTITLIAKDLYYVCMRERVEAKLLSEVI